MPRLPTVSTLVVVALAAGIAAAPVVPATAGAGAAQATCQGKRATVVGEAGAIRVSGTSRADVIVSNGVWRVYGGGGDDLICITGRTTATRVFDGPGDDVVDARGAAGPISADLNDGSDVYRGSPFADRFRQDQARPTGGEDVIYAGAGDDEVQWDNRHGEDVIQLGPGEDRVRMLVRPASAVSEVFGGDGEDELAFYAPPSRYHLDLATGRMVGPERRLMGVTGFERYDLGDLGSEVYQTPPAQSRVVVTGTAAAEEIDMGRPFDSQQDSDFTQIDRHVQIALGAGDDVLQARANDSGVLQGGQGDDQVVVHGTSGLAAEVTEDDVVVRDEHDPDYYVRTQLRNCESVETTGFASD